MCSGSSDYDIFLYKMSNLVLASISIIIVSFDKDNFFSLLGRNLIWF